MSKPYSLQYKTKMIERMVGTAGISASKLSDETGVAQGTLSKWLREARSLRVVKGSKRIPKVHTVDDKIRILAEAAKLTGEELTTMLEREGASLAHLDEWRAMLGQHEAPASMASAGACGDQSGANSDTCVPSGSHTIA